MGLNYLIQRNWLNLKRHKVVIYVSIPVFTFMMILIGSIYTKSLVEAILKAPISPIVNQHRFIWFGHFFFKCVVSNMNDVFAQGMCLHLNRKKICIWSGSIILSPMLFRIQVLNSYFLFTGLNYLSKFPSWAMNPECHHREIYLTIWFSIKRCRARRWMLLFMCLSSILLVWT